MDSSFSILCSFLCKPHTDRFPDGVKKKLWQKSNRDSCEKNTTGTEYTGIRSIPARIDKMSSGCFYDTSQEGLRRRGSFI
jgi:hypothetical protein